MLSARGAGADRLSEEARTAVANLDVGGGTTNIAVFDKGKLAGVCCLDIGGRLIRVEHGRIAYVYHKIEALARAHGIALRAGDAADVEMLRRVCGLMADQLAQALSRRPPDGQHAGLYTNGGKPLPEAARARAVTYSGGVADCIYTPPEGDVFRYGDVGVLLGQAIRGNADLGGLRLFRPAAAPSIMRGDACRSKMYLCSVYPRRTRPRRKRCATPSGVKCRCTSRRDGSNRSRSRSAAGPIPASPPSKSWPQR